jgi:ribosomal protein L5
MLVGCKVTLRKKNLAEFFDSLSLALPRMEKFSPVKVKTNNTNSYSLKLAEVVLFYPIELGLGVNTEVQKIEINFFFKTTSIEEKIFLLTSNKIPVLNK